MSIKLGEIRVVLCLSSLNVQHTTSIKTEQSFSTHTIDALVTIGDITKCSVVWCGSIWIHFLTAGV